MNPSTQSRQTAICQSIKQGIQRHIKFRLPDAAVRRELFALHLPTPDGKKIPDIFLFPKKTRKREWGWVFESMKAVCEEIASKGPG